MKKILYIILVALIFILGIYLRFDAYLISNSFFTDEILLAKNVLEKNFLELFFPLKYYQSAPYIFLVLSKFLTSHLGYFELSFRFLPFLFSLMSLFVFYFLSKNLFKTKIPVLVSVLTFAISYQAIFYSQVFKQYSSDIFISSLFLLIAIKFRENISNVKNALHFALFSIFCFYFSLPSVFFIIAFYITLILFTPNRKIALFSSLLPFASFLVFYLSRLLIPSDILYFKMYWNDGFQIFSPFIYKLNYEFLFGYYPFYILFIFLFMFGFYFLYKNNKFLFLFFSLTFFNSLLAAYFQIYPFEKRLILYLLPLFILIISYSLDFIKKSKNSYLIIISSFVFFISGFINFSIDFIQGNVSYLRQDIKPLLYEIKNKNKDVDGIYVYYGAILSYNYYKNLLNLPVQNVVFAQYPNDENNSCKYLIEDFNNLIGTYYLIFVKGTDTYEKDIETALQYFKNKKILEDISLKSSRLFKVVF